MKNVRGEFGDNICFLVCFKTKNTLVLSRFRWVVSSSIMRQRWPWEMDRSIFDGGDLVINLARRSICSGKIQFVESIRCVTDNAIFSVGLSARLPFWSGFLSRWKTKELSQTWHRAIAESKRLHLLFFLPLYDYSLPKQLTSVANIFTSPCKSLLCTIKFIARER